MDGALRNYGGFACEAGRLSRTRNAAATIDATFDHIAVTFWLH
jgi:hypothetical protein